MTGSKNAEHEYVTGQSRPGFPALLAEFEERSAEAAAVNPQGLDLPYGPGERQRLDFFPATRPGGPTLVYLHAGYWQSRDKRSFRFLAPPFNLAGLNVALVNYPLCPSTTMAELVSEVRSSIPAIAALAGGGGLILSGHSAGGHLAVELALTEWTAGISIGRVVSLSGVFDLEPLLDTSLNRNLGLTAEKARAASPVHRVVAGLPPAVFAVGGDETDAFIGQNDRMAAAWRAQANVGRTVVVEGADHFTILHAFTDPGSVLFSLTVDDLSASA